MLEQPVTMVCAMRKESIDLEHRGVFSPTEIKDFLFNLWNGWAWDKLFRTEFVKSCGYKFSDFRSSEDGFFVYMLLAKAKRIGVIKKSLVFHRMYNFNSLSNTKEQNWKNGFKMLESIRSELLRQDLYSLYEQSFVSIAIEFQVDYLKSIVSTSLDAIDRYHLSRGDYERTIAIPTAVGAGEKRHKIHAVDFDISKEDSRGLFENGWSAAECFLRTWNK